MTSVLVRLLPSLLAAASLITLAACTSSPNSAETNTNSASQAPATTHASGHNAAGDAKININTAILSELDQLESALGIPALSHKIQASRPYGSPEELVSKNVLTQAQFDQIKDRVTIADVVLTGEAKDIDYMTKMGLMKGHLIVARELIDQKQLEQAEPHIGHPVEEIYVDVEEQLQERQVPEFKGTLISLQDLVKAKSDASKIEPNFKASTTAVDNAIAALPEGQRQSPAFVLQVIDGLLDAANAEYGAAIANNQVSAAIEYQDSRGFVVYANSLYQTIADKMAAEHPEAHQAIEANLTKLLTAWPSAIAPKTPVMTPEQVTELIKSIEQQAQKVAA